ncbi:MAG: DNA topoisomerase 4 subunit A [Planctomycetota bacterium]|nr:DNA topoisomerase 4 subunit A [Planctomycetota bacterium]
MAKKRANQNGQPQATLGFEESDRIHYVSISDETRRRYLNYAMSVITSRALPDVRDGLKPVQRRILFVMYQARLLFENKAHKCMKICGATTGNFHPHGETSVYDALVRLAQDFNLRMPLVDGQGNFGSVMGLNAAAARYTEAKLTRISQELMGDLNAETVEMRPNSDGSQHEPVVLPARFPNLLINGTQGIAVGMATNIPPHNLGEVVKACVHLINNPEAGVRDLMKFIKGPDFPLGGRIVSDRDLIRTAYETGRGSIKVRGEWRFDKDGRQETPNRIVIYSVPYAVTTNPLMAEIGEVIAGRKLPQLDGANDETDDEHGLRIVLDLKPGANAEQVMSYLFKHTRLEQNFAFNTTCLVPSEQGVLVPALCSLTEVLQHFLDFRFQTVKRRFEYELRQLERRIHILEGFAIIFAGLDKALKIIRASSGRQDAADALVRAFPLDEVQAIAIVDLQLYRISQLEIDKIRAELDEKRKAAERIRKILKSDRKLWGVVEKELIEIAESFGDKRRTKIGSSDDVSEFDPQAYIIRENTNVVITHDGWIKRVGRLASVAKTKVRDGDKVLDVLPVSTLDCCVFLATDGSAYTLSVADIPVSSGYGEPLVKHVRMGDGVRIIAAISTDPRFTAEDSNASEDEPSTPHVLVVTAHGQVMRLPLANFRTPSTKLGRKYCRLRKEDRVVYARLISDATTMFIATRKARLVHFAIDEVPVLSNAGIGVRGIKVDASDSVLGAMQLARPSDTLRVRNENDKVLSFGQTKYGVTSRGGKGHKTSQRTNFVEIVPPDIQLVDWAELEK